MKKRIIIFGIFMALTAIGMSQTVWNGSNTTGNAYRSGNVGIGTTTSPTKALEIKTATANDGILITQTSSGHSTFRLDNTSTAGHKYGFCSSGTGSTEGPGHFILYDYTDNRYNLFISGGGSGYPAAGNIGIGTTNPGDKLQVGDTYQKIAFGGASSQALNYGTSYIGFNATRQSGNWSTSTDTYHNGGSLIYGTVFGDIVFSNLPSSGNVANGQSNVTDATIWQNRKLWINPNGNIQVGATGPQGAHANAKFSVDGKIVAQSLYVTASGSPNWADYVFANDYKLPNLYDIEKYYQANKHLPEIPSAAEVKENGINVGEMNALLLKKIEEMTILMVKQQREIDELKTKVK